MRKKAGEERNGGRRLARRDKRGIHGITLDKTEEDWGGRERYTKRRTDWMLVSILSDYSDEGVKIKSGFQKNTPKQF